MCITIGVLIGSTLGGFMPAFWGDDALFSITGILCSTAGGFVGIWAGYKFYHSYFGNDNYFR